MVIILQLTSWLHRGGYLSSRCTCVTCHRSITFIILYACVQSTISTKIHQNGVDLLLVRCNWSKCNQNKFAENCFTSYSFGFFIQQSLLKINGIFFPNLLLSIYCNTRIVKSEVHWCARFLVQQMTDINSIPPTHHFPPALFLPTS